MKSNLVNGRIPEPKSLGAARSRHEQLVREIASIERQIADPISSTKHATGGAFDAWLMSAKRALRYLTEEAKQLARWIDANPESKLLAEALELLRRLRREDVDFDPDEDALIARLEIACADTPSSRTGLPHRVVG